jgi:TolA-binding protein
MPLLAFGCSSPSVLIWKRRMPHLVPKLLFSVALVSSLSSAVLADDFSSATAQVSSLEIALSGKPKTSEPLMKRVQALETVILGHPSSGTLQNRLELLKSNLGLNESQLKQFEQNHPSSPGPSSPGTSAPFTTAAKPAGQNIAGAKSAGRQSTTAAKPAGQSATASKPAGQMQSMLAAAVKLYQSGNTDGAKRAFENVLAQYPYSVDACYNLGSLAEKRGDTNSALRYYTKAQKLDPSDPQIKAAAERVKQDSIDIAAANSQATSSSQPASKNYPQAQSSNSYTGSDPYYSGLSSHHGSAHAVVTAGKHILGFTVKKGLGTVSSF